MKKINIKKITSIALFCAIAYLCMFVFRIKVQFLTFDAKDAVTTICALLYGPIAGITVSVVVAFIEFLSVSDTALYGLIMNMLSSIAFCVPASIIYSFRKKTSSAVAGLSLSVVSVVAVMIGANLLVTPHFMGTSVEVVKSMLLPLIIPFNATKAILNAGLTMLLYKPVVEALRKAKLVPKSQEDGYKFNKKSVVILISSIIIVVAAIVFFSLVLGGNIELIKK